MTDFDNAQVGDKVFIEWTGWSREKFVSTIQKVTKTQLTVDGDKWNRRTGRMIGSSGSYTYRFIRPFDESEWETYKQQVWDETMRRTLGSFDWVRCDIELVRSIYDMLPKAEK